MIPITLMNPSLTDTIAEGLRVSVVPDKGDYLVFDNDLYFVHGRIIHSNYASKYYPKVIVKVTLA